MDFGSISTQYYLSVLRILSDIGCEREEILPKVGIAEHELFDPKGRISCEQLLNTFNIAGEYLGEPNIGMQVGYRFRVHTFTETGSILALCSSIAEAAEMNAHFQPLSDTIGVSEFQRRDEGAFLIWNAKFDNDDKYRHVTELVVAGYVTTTNWLAWGFDKGVANIRFKHSAPANLSGYDLVFGKSYSFGNEDNSLEFNPDAVDKLLPTNNPQKLNLIRSRLDIILRNFEKKSDLKQRVRELVHKGIADENLSFSNIASSLGMSERNLRRNLSDEGVKYRDLVENVRRDLCQGYILDGRTFTQIAQILGYNDQSAFTRAFKKWYGVSPTAYDPKDIHM